MARELVEDPEYRAALHRRLADGKAPRMMRLLLQWADKKSRDPEELRRGTPPLTYAAKYLSWDPEHDPMREPVGRMIEAKARPVMYPAAFACHDTPGAYPYQGER
jgi:hypothetical protein